MKIGAVAKLANVGIDTVRYYEERGLLSATRTPAGYRSFSAATIERIRFVRELQAIGLSLDEIVDVLAQMDRGTRACGSKDSAFDAALARIEERLSELRAIRRRLLMTVAECKRGRCLLVERTRSIRHRARPYAQVGG